MFYYQDSEVQASIVILFALWEFLVYCNHVDVII